jgi:hypothetical protein
MIESLKWVFTRLSRLRRGTNVSTDAGEIQFLRNILIQSSLIGNFVVCLSRESNCQANPS